MTASDEANCSMTLWASDINERTDPSNRSSRYRRRWSDRLQDGDVGSQAPGDPGRINADDAPTQYQDPGRRHAGCSAGQYPPPTHGSGQVVGHHLAGEPAGDLAHRGEQREVAVGVFDGFISHAGGPRTDQRGGQRRSLRPNGGK